MHRWFVVLLIFVVLRGLVAAEDRKPAIGDVIPELRFKDIRALPRSLTDLGAKRAYVLVFTTTQCPLVRRTMPKLAELDAQYGSQNVQFVAVNVGADDTIRDMAAQALEFDVSFPFVQDIELNCARSLGVERTPGVAVLSADRKLVYRGRVDDQLRLGGARPTATRRDLAEALQELLEQRPVSVAETPVDGCLITMPRPREAGQPEPTFSRDVAPIVYRRCAPCHRPGTAAPFSLLTYADTAAQAEMLAEVVLDQRMPPWYAHAKFGSFQNDPSLTRQERDSLVRWARSSRLPGDPRDAPPPPEMSSSEWKIGEPDVVIRMVDEHTIPPTGFLPYRHVVLPYVFLEDTWVEAVEIRPDNPAVVHHSNMGYASPSGVGPENFVTGYVPGGQPLDLGRFKAGVACRFPRFSVLGLEIHYTTTGKPEKCRIAVGLRFPRNVVRKQFRHVMLDPRRFRIPPGHGAYAVRAERTLDRDVQVLGLFAHMHLRGKDMTFLATPPEGPPETLLQIPNYNFEWQLGYEITPGQKRLPRGTKVAAVAHFDNSPFNPYNPDPTRTVPWGLQTYDEMMNAFLFYVDETEDLQLSIDPQTGRVRTRPPGKQGS